MVNGVIYFNAFSDEGCVKIYKYAPGDPMVTKPIANVNEDECNPIPDQIATEPDTAFGNGQVGSIPHDRGHDTPVPRYFAPIGLGTRVYFVASNGSRYDVYEYDPKKKSTSAITRLLTPVVSPAGLYLLGVDAGQLVFAAADGIYRYTPGGPLVTAPTTPGAPPVGIEVATGILLDNVNYFEHAGNLARWTIGDGAPTSLSEHRRQPEQPRRDRRPRRHRRQGGVLRARAERGFQPARAPDLRLHSRRTGAGDDAPCRHVQQSMQRALNTGRADRRPVLLQRTRPLEGPEVLQGAVAGLG